MRSTGGIVRIHSIQRMGWGELSIIPDEPASPLPPNRVIRHLGTEAGIRQFLDIGTGLPTADNTHEVAQRVNPEARIVYVDNDPLILAHANALLVRK